MATEKLVNQNIRAFADMLAYSEGTDRHGQPTKNQGYDVLVGGELFTDYSDHPRKRVWIPKYKIYSTAAGRYQILERMFDAYKNNIPLPDFSPESQDLYLLQIIKEQGAYWDIVGGKLQKAIDKLADQWASLPGSKYGQHTNQFEALRAFFILSGGEVC